MKDQIDTQKKASPMKHRLKVAGLTTIILIGLAAAYYIQQRTSSDSYARLNPAGVCNAEFGGEELEPLQSALPKGEQITIKADRHAHDVNNPQDFWSNCTIIVDGTAALKIKSELIKKPKEDWRRDMQRKGVAIDDLQELDIGDSSFNTPFSAAIYVSCENLIFDHKPVRLSTTVVIPQASRSRSGQHRVSLTETALNAAHSGDSNSQCEPGTPLPPYPLEIY
ncbi:hypothetical protein [Streptomyces sp. TR06-5]|uniref:hypothetical protein n=1 Tax=unclassified Streptomyces TaxID=2593676 RepID=UPI0039A3391A